MNKEITEAKRNNDKVGAETLEDQKNRRKHNDWLRHLCDRVNGKRKGEVCLKNCSAVECACCQECHVCQSVLTSSKGSRKKPIRIKKAAFDMKSLVQNVSLKQNGHSIVRRVLEEGLLNFGIRDLKRTRNVAASSDERPTEFHKDTAGSEIKESKIESIDNASSEENNENDAEGANEENETKTVELCASLASASPSSSCVDIEAVGQNEVRETVRQVLDDLEHRSEMADVTEESENCLENIDLEMLVDSIENKEGESKNEDRANLSLQDDDCYEWLLKNKSQEICTAQNLEIEEKVKKDGATEAEPILLKNVACAGTQYDPEDFPQDDLLKMLLNLVKSKKRPASLGSGDATIRDTLVSQDKDVCLLDDIEPPWAMDTSGTSDDFCLFESREPDAFKTINDNASVTVQETPKNVTSRKKPKRTVKFADLENVINVTPSSEPAAKKSRQLPIKMTKSFNLRFRSNKTIKK